MRTAIIEEDEPRVFYTHYTPKRRIEFSIDTVPISPNKYSKHTGRWVYQAERKRLLMHLLDPTLRWGPKFPFQHARLMIICSRLRRLDKDNNDASCKPLIDCMKVWIQRPNKIEPWGKKGHGWIVDDCPSVLLETRIFQEKSRVDKTHIVIEEID
jgi:hypothetical protein